MDVVVPVAEPIVVLTTVAERLVGLVPGLLVDDRFVPGRIELAAVADDAPLDRVADNGRDVLLVEPLAADLYAARHRAL
jgi:hypothetical protein